MWFSIKLSCAPLCYEAFILSQMSPGFYRICFNQSPSWEQFEPQLEFVI